MRVAVCIPARDMVHSGFAFDLAQMSANFCAQTKGNQFSILTSLGTLIADQREGLAEEAIDLGATHVMWLDSDMRFPMDIIQRLAAHDLPIVAANYPTRRKPISTVAFDFKGNGPTHRDCILTKPDSTGLEEVAAVGMGAMLVQIEVYETLNKPWFFTPFNSDTGRLVGEDVWFCQKARIAGLKVFIDHDVSKEIAHAGTVEYTHADVDPAAEFLLPKDAEDAA